MTIEKKLPSVDEGGPPMPGFRFPSASEGDRWDEIDRIGRVLDAVHPRPAFAQRPASDLAGISDPDELAFELHCSFHLLDLNCPEIQRLIESVKGSYHGAFIVNRMAPKAAVGKPDAIRRKRQPKGKRPILPNLFSLANELAAAQEASAATES
ncbi:MAG: hypothetical protein J0I54_15990 [Bosea sp.]|uniref:hypothetical protein n=1 Tax=unclassified Bosea (in: a-proteobacteria) TaxID=2653178 RepID=UPI001ACE3CEE|nr:MULTISPECIES: hypothetical protein [unclassified Bosea (in: a-proteobacteria)]MBN9458134.1 hypothetical protein [Bosea sp. (in: a-proteobacteria)]